MAVMLLNREIDPGTKSAALFLIPLKLFHGL